MPAIAVGTMPIAPRPISTLERMAPASIAAESSFDCDKSQESDHRYRFRSSDAADILRLAREGIPEVQLPRWIEEDALLLSGRLEGLDGALHAILERAMDTASEGSPP